MIDYGVLNGKTSTQAGEASNARTPIGSNA